MSSKKMPLKEFVYFFVNHMPWMCFGLFALQVNRSE